MATRAVRGALYWYAVKAVAKNRNSVLSYDLPGKEIMAVRKYRQAQTGMPDRALEHWLVSFKEMYGANEIHEDLANRKLYKARRIMDEIRAEYEGGSG